MIFTVKPSYPNINSIRNLLFSIFILYQLDIETHVKLWQGWWIVITCISLFQNQHTSWLSTMLDDSPVKYMNANLNKLYTERLSRRHKMLLRLKHSPISWIPLYFFSAMFDSCWLGSHTTTMNFLHGAPVRFACGCFQEGNHNRTWKHKAGALNVIMYCSLFIILNTKATSYFKYTSQLPTNNLSLTL